MYQRKPFWMLIVFLVALSSLPLVAQTAWEINHISSSDQTSMRANNTTDTEHPNKTSLSTESSGSMYIPSARVVHVWPVHGARRGFKTLLQAQVENTGNIPLPPDAMVRFWVNGLKVSDPCLVGTSPVLGLRPGTTRWYTFVWSAPDEVPRDGITYQVQVSAGDTPLSPLSDPRAVEFEDRIIKAPQLVSPSDVTLNNTPTFVWKSVAGATWYVLKVHGPSGNTIRKWYRSEDVSRGSACMGKLTVPLSRGSHTWCVQPWSVDGYGQNSKKKRFNIG